MKDLKNSNSDKLLIVVAGPTAVGKTSLSIELARHLKTEIISADSRQFYREMKIGTAAPSTEELAAVPHHFIGNLSIHDYYNVFRYETDVLILLEKLFSKYNCVIITGGSGLYINAVCDGIDELPDPDPLLREQLNQMFQVHGISYLQNQLLQSDPEYFKVVDKQNPIRLIRAIEVCKLTGKTYSALRSEQSKPRNFRVLKIGLFRERETLNDIINQRVDNMMKNGLLEEVRALYSFKHLNALNTVGYRELFAFLDGNITLSEAVTNIKTNTRRYAKRQMTWFKKYPDFRWFHPDQFEEITRICTENQE